MVKRLPCLIISVVLFHVLAAVAAPQEAVIADQEPKTILAQLQQTAASLVQAALDKQQPQHTSTPMLSNQQYMDLISFAATVGEQIAGAGDASSAQQASTAQAAVLAGVQENSIHHETSADSVAAGITEGLNASPAAETEVLRSRSAGRRLMSDFGASLLGPAGVSIDAEALLSDDLGGVAGYGTAALVPSSVVQTAAAGTGNSGGTGGTGGLNSLSNNCFMLPVELCIAIRRANLNVATYAYPYVLGYLAVAAISMWQTLIAATAAGSLVIDAKLLLTLGQQFSLVVALLGGLGVVISVDQLYRILPM